MRKTVKVPIFFQFDSDKVIGWVELESKYQKLIPRFVLVAGYVENKKVKVKGGGRLIAFGFIQSKDRDD